MATTTYAIDLHEHYAKYLAFLRRQAPFVLRLTEHHDRPIPVLVIKERQNIPALCQAALTDTEHQTAPHGNLVDLGRLAGTPLRRCLPTLRLILGRVRDHSGAPMELQRYLSPEGLKLRLNLPLDEEAGAKLGLIFRLQSRLSDMDRVELIARRLARFTREEAVYWLSRTTSFGPDANRWAVAGLRIMLAGNAKDRAVERMLEHLRQTA